MCIRDRLRTGQALLLNCRTPQSYCTAPGQSCWHHYWVHLDGAGAVSYTHLDVYKRQEQGMLQMVRTGDMNYKQALSNSMSMSAGVPVQSLSLIHISMLAE